MEALIVVSNRLPFVLHRDRESGGLRRKCSAGGLVTAVAPVVVKCRGLWVGWPGLFLDDPLEPIPEAEDDSSAAAGLLSNQSYVEVNEIFAEKTVASVRSLVSETLARPLVWIHDYHLMLVAKLLRKMMASTGILLKLGFFLHIPFPPRDIFRLLPWGKQVLEGLLACDLVAFHIEDYCINFIDCCQRELGCRVNRESGTVEYEGRRVSVRALPIGIPFDWFDEMAHRAPRVVRADPDHRIILGVDRLDYTKGLVHRLRAFELLLDKYPEYIEKVIFMQVAVPSRTDVKEYQDLKEEMDQLVGRINGRFSTAIWSPIRYIYGCISQVELAAFYRDADVALVTPLRDGMNLVAKEFVACQVDSPGVLILSPFAGAGEMMHEALVVNPYEANQVAVAIRRALEMPLDERQLRMTNLRRRERLNDVDAWTLSFLKSMNSSLLGVPTGPESSTTGSTEEDFAGFLAKYLAGSTDKLALLLDYDGTLAPIAPHPDLAVIPQETKKVLERLANCPDVHISIISGRTVSNVKQMMGIANVTYAGSHGLEIVHPDGTTFAHPIPDESVRQMSRLLHLLQDQVCLHGAWVENKGTLLTYHYRDVPEAYRPELVEQARSLIEESALRCVPAHCALEARPAVPWDKGRAAIYILRTAFGVDWNGRIRVIFAGDDVTDEDAISTLKGIAATFRVTSSAEVKSSADRRLKDTDSVLALLKWVERFMANRSPVDESVQFDLLHE